MPGFSDYAAQASLNHATGAIPLGATKTRFLALFTAAPTSDAGTGGTEVALTGYARVQIAGQLAAAASGAPWASTTILLSAAAPAWLLALGTNGSGCNVYDATSGAQIGTVSSISGATVTLTAAAASSVANSDSLQFSAFAPAAASSGTEPSVTPCAATLGALTAFASMATVSVTITIPAFGVYDALTGGNLYTVDYLNLSGFGKWSPFTCTAASPGVLTVTDQAFAAGTSVVVTSKFGGSLPATAGSWAGLLTVANVSGATFTAGVNTTAGGDGFVRPVTPLVVSATPMTVQFPAGNLVVSSA